MSPRGLNEQTPTVDAIDASIAQGMPEFRKQVEAEFALRHLDELHEEHPLFLDAAAQWMHSKEKEFMSQDRELDLESARILALDTLLAELNEDEEDPALIDVVMTFKKVTLGHFSLPDSESHELAA